MVYPKNSALREEPLDQVAPVIPLNRDSSILGWLEDIGRLVTTETDDLDYSYGEDTAEELSEFVGETDTFDLDEDDTDDLEEL